MRILLVTYFFAPANTMGALRLTRLASFLSEAGHEVRVLTVDDSGFPETLNWDFPDVNVRRTPQADINRLPRWLATRRHASGTISALEASDRSSASRSPSPGLGARVLHGASRLYTNALNWPDARAGWLPYALRAGRSLVHTWRPELIYASSPPPSGLLIGKLLAAHCCVPWIAEFRDRWSDDPYDAKPAWRQTMEAGLERRIVASARAIVTVSEPWAERYAEAYGRPTLVVLNGFEPGDYAGRESTGAINARWLEIAYTGGIYPGRRDPTPLFRALATMPEGPADVRVRFFGTDPLHVLPLAAEAGVQDRVFVHPHVPRAEAVAIQQSADVLLLMQWNDPREHGNLPGKLFEYLGARRPILGLGLEDGAPATILRAHAAGCFTNDPERIAAQLTTWLATKRRLGRLSPLSREVAAGFTRAEQFAKLEPILGP